MLTYSVALGSPEDVEVPTQHEMTGWLLKKKRKKMQGTVNCFNWETASTYVSPFIKKRLG